MKIGILGGSGLYDIEGIEDIEERRLETPLGTPSDAYICGRMGGKDVCFLPRHARGHKLLPSEINHRANIMGMKMLGVGCVVSISAVGSLRKEIRPRDIVLPDQYFDRTKNSLEHTFFGAGLVAHIGFAEPACPELRGIIAEVARDVIGRRPAEENAEVHCGGTYVNMEGPAFSTKAESNVYRSFGFDVIGMTSLGEAKLCREAEICYQAMAMATDYDCWHESEEAVSVEMLVGHLNANTQLAKQILQELIPRMPSERGCDCGRSLASAIFTASENIPDDTRAKLRPIIGKYID